MRRSHYVRGFGFPVTAIPANHYIIVSQIVFDRRDQRGPGIGRYRVHPGKRIEIGRSVQEEAMTSAQVRGP